MTPEHLAHLDRIKAQFAKDVTEKYTKGAIEHGGQLWLMTGLLDEAINEAVDMYVYLVTLKEQLKGRTDA